MSSKPRISGIDSVSTGDRQTPKRSQRQHRSHHKYSDIDVDEGETVADDTNVDRVTTPLKLTIKIGGQTLGEKSVNKSSIRALSSTANTSANVAPNEDQLELSMSFDDEEDDEEEEADDSVRSDDVVSEPVDDDEWLDALEEGRGLHEVDDELKRIRDPKLMTARQRALLENKCLKERTEAAAAKSSSSAPVSQEADKLSDEMIERKLVKDRRRRQQAEEKREKDRKQTIDRLLRKRQELAQRARRRKRVETPRITYKNCVDGIYICLPPGVAVDELMGPRGDPRPLVPQSPVRVKCARDGCENEKRYLCSKNRQPVCSLACYKVVNE